MKAESQHLKGKFLQFLETEKRYSKHTVENYSKDIDDLEKFCSVKKINSWDEIKPHHVRTYASQIFIDGLGARSIQRKLSAIRSFMNYLVRENLLRTNPADGVKTPKAPKKLPGVLDVDQINQLLNIKSTEPISLRDKAIMELLYSSGLRLAELVALNPIDLNTVSYTHLRAHET